MRHRRILVTLGAILALSMVAGPAFAEDLEDYLEKAADADYAGTRVVVTVWQGRSVAEMTRVEHSSDVVMLVDDDGDIKYASPGLVGTLGHRSSDWIGRPVVECEGPHELESMALNMPSLDYDAATTTYGGRFAAVSAPPDVRLVTSYGDPVVVPVDGP